MLGLNPKNTTRDSGQSKVKKFWNRRTKEAVFIGVCTNIWSLYIEVGNMVSNYSWLFMVH